MSAIILLGLLPLTQTFSFLVNRRVGLFLNVEKGKKHNIKKLAEFSSSSRQSTFDSSFHRRQLLLLLLYSLSSLSLSHV